MRAIFTCATLTVIGLSGCVLPSYEEQSEPNRTNGSGSHADDDAGVLPGAGCGLSNKLPSKCDACIREHCCDLAKKCGAGTDCGKDVLEKITPVASFSKDFDELLGCMQDRCDEPCAVSWGCVDDYSWPEPKADLDVPVTVVDFAAEPDKPLPGVEVQACQSVDAACDTGKVASAETDALGLAELKIPAGFVGFFSFSGADYMDSTVQWSEPVYRLTGFKQLQLTAAALDALALVTGEHHKASEPFDPDAGHLIFRVQNCLPVRYLDASRPPMGQAAGAKVTFEPHDGASRVFYTDENGAVSTTLEATSSDGVGGAFEAPARNLTVHAVDIHSGKEVATGGVRVRAGAIGYSYLVPRAQQ